MKDSLTTVLTVLNLSPLISKTVTSDDWQISVHI